MKSIIPFSKEIIFDSKIAEITSISLEHEIHLNDSNLEGDFLISGDYKSHEISVNKEPFSYRLPFSVELSDDVDTNTVEFDITDFTYEIPKDNVLKVQIEFSVTASEKQVEEKEEEEDIRMDESIFESPEEVMETPLDMPALQEEIKNDPAPRMDQESETTILETIHGADDAFATYHVHIVREGDSVETICTLYNSNIDLLASYNDMNAMNIGDKIIVPSKENE